MNCSKVGRTLAASLSSLIKSSSVAKRSLHVTAVTPARYGPRYIPDKILPKLLKMHEPAYLDEGGSETELYDLVNIQIKGYDFPTVEAFAKFVHNSATRFGLDVEDSWGTPCKKMHITRLKPESSNKEAEYFLNLYDRTVQLADVPCTSVPLFLNFVEASLPAGVQLDAHLHDPDETEIRYIPDYELEELQSQLEDIHTQTQKK